ncbi:MAG TPA: carotenoid biosynthesis protein, partial [Sorangium sp.]|nr:carotenoid biosynthesis protein [Sorangium sp.]
MTLPSMALLEGVALLIVALFVFLRARYGPAPKAFLRRLLLLVVASWLAENSVIVAYDFYSYSPDWTLFIHHVPLAIVLIWPIVIHSAWELAGYLLGPSAAAKRLAPLVGAFLVLADAAMIEPIAVSAKL